MRNFMKGEILAITQRIKKIEQMLCRDDVKTLQNKRMKILSENMSNITTFEKTESPTTRLVTNTR